MAEENENKIEEEQQSSPKKLPVKWIIIVLAVIVMAGGGFAGWTMVKEQPPTETVADEGKAEEKIPKTLPETEVGLIFIMDPFVVNLSDPGGKRYLKSKIELEYFGDQVHQELTARLPQLRDVILLHLSSKMLDEIQSVDGKIELKNALIKRINQVLKAGNIKNLYFTQFVIQ